MAFYFALFNVANANQEIRDQHHHYRRQSNAQHLLDNQSRDRRRHSVSSSSSNRNFFSDFRLLPRPKVLGPSVNQKIGLNEVNSSMTQSFCNDVQNYSKRRLSSPTFSPSTSLPSSDTAMTVSALARFHHNTKESPNQTPCCSPTLQDRQIKKAERPCLLQHSTPISVKHMPETKLTSIPISNRPQNATNTPTSKKVTFMSVSASNDYFEKAKRERYRKLSADNIGKFLDLGDLAAWNMKAVIVPRRKPHRHTADLSRHKEPFIEIPSNKTIKNLSQPQNYLLRRGSAAAEIRLPDRRVSAQPEHYFSVGSVGAKHLTSSNVNNNNHLPHSPAKVQRSKSSRTADAVEMATVNAWRVLRRQRRNSAEEKLLEKEKRAFGSDLKPVCSSSSQRKLQAELIGHAPLWQDQGMNRENRRQKSIVRRRSTSDQHSLTKGCRRNNEEMQWKILHNCIQKFPGRKTGEFVTCNANHNKTWVGEKGCCEVCGAHLDVANGNSNVSKVAKQMSIIPQQAISIAAPEAIPLIPKTYFNNRKKTEEINLETLKSQLF